VFCWLICLGAYYAVLYRPVGRKDKVLGAEAVSG
jgi:membrane-associated PAP2 superfamily phosphatase